MEELKKKERLTASLNRFIECGRERERIRNKPTLTADRIPTLCYKDIELLYVLLNALLNFARYYACFQE